MGHGIRSLNCTRKLVLSACVVFGLAAPVAAQTSQGSTAAPVERRETIIGGTGQAAPTFERCIEVQIGSEGSFGCLNQKLRREVDRINPSLNLPPIDARSADVRVGNVNAAAVRQQYGSSFGRSAIPFRPPVPTYVLPRR
ncbi:MAG: hypothetical protein V4517_10635 [Pseudomonadota bacterium]